MRHFLLDHAYAWGNFSKWVFYGSYGLPSSCIWLVPGTVTDETRFND